MRKSLCLCLLTSFALAFVAPSNYAALLPWRDKIEKQLQGMKQQSQPQQAPAPIIVLPPNPQVMPLVPNPQVMPLVPNPQVMPLVPNPQVLPIVPNPQVVPIVPNPQPIEIKPNPQVVPPSINPQVLPVMPPSGAPVAPQSAPNPQPIGPNVNPPAGYNRISLWRVNALWK